MNLFWTNATKLMKNSELSQSDLARHLEINKTRVNNWLKKDITPPADFAYRIARLLNTTVENLVTGEEIIDPAVIYLKKNPMIRKNVIRMGLYPAIIPYVDGYIEGLQTSLGLIYEDKQA